jgi:hypothetical protein
MNNSLQIFAEYKVKSSEVKEYEASMKHVIEKLYKLGAEEVKWYKAHDQGDLYVEMYTVPSHEKYMSIKDSRLLGNEQEFSHMRQFVVGGADKLHMWAFVQIQS